MDISFVYLLAELYRCYESSRAILNLTSRRKCPVSGGYKALPIKENLRNSTSPHALYLARLVGLWVWPYFLKSSRCGRSHRSNYKKRLGEGEGSQRFLFREVVYDSKGFLESINTVWKGLQTNSSRFYHSVSDTIARAAHPRKRTAWRVKHFI